MAHLTCRECPRCQGRKVIWMEFVTMPPYTIEGGVYDCPDCGGEGVVTDELVIEEKEPL